MRNVWRALTAGLLVLMVLTGCAGTRKQAGSEPAADKAAANTVRELTILHWNDFHSRNLPRRTVARGETLLVGGYARLAGMAEQARDSLDAVLLLHAGDDFQGTPISGMTRGRSQFDILRALKPDAFAVGNHEFDYSTDTLLAISQGLPFPLLSANVVREEGGELLFAPDTVLEAGGIRVGVIGLMTPLLREVTIRSATEGLAVTDPAEAVRRSLARLDSISDIQLVLSHMGFWQDSVLAERIGGEGIELIVGGHSHTQLDEPRRINGVVIAQAGDYGRKLGVLELVVDTAADSLLALTGRLEPVLVEQGPLHEEVAAIVAAQEQLVAREMDRVVAKLKVDWVRDRRAESNVGNWVADAFATAAGTDIAFVNSGGLRDDIKAGPLTVRELFRVAPFGNQLVSFELSGQDLRRYVHHEARTPEHMQISGLAYTLEGEEVTRLEVDGRPVHPDSSYSAVTLTYVGDHFELYFGLDPEEHPLRETGMLDRQALTVVALRQGVIASEVEGRAIFELQAP